MLGEGLCLSHGTLLIFWSEDFIFEQRPISGESMGAMFIQLGQAGAVVAGVGSIGLAIRGDLDPRTAAGTTALAIVYLVAPNALGRAFRNPEIIKWLTIGAEHSPGTVPAIKASLAAIGLLLKNKIFAPEDEERAVAQAQSLSKKLKDLGK